jgi:hypothetical protein
VGTKPWVQEGTQLDLPDITKNKHQGIWRAL